MSNELKDCKCGGKAIIEDGFGGGKFACCLECDNQTAVYPDFAESAAIQDWNNEAYENELYTPEMSGSGQYATCAKCGKDPTKEGHDGCIGTLPSKDVMNACCGHGDDSIAYVQFWDSPRISGQEAIDYIKLETKEV